MGDSENKREIYRIPDDEFDAIVEALCRHYYSWHGCNPDVGYLKPIIRQIGITRYKTADVEDNG